MLISRRSKLEFLFWNRQTLLAVYVFQLEDNFKYQLQELKR